MPVVDIAIIGGGASGTILALRLLEAMSVGKVCVIDPSPCLGRGIAYGSDNPSWLLNVRASNMSAKPEDPTQFVRWLEANGFSGDDVGQRFVPRGLFGAYLGDLLETARRTSPAEFLTIADRAVSLRRGDYLTVGLDHSEPVEAKTVVLALGNLPPSLPSALKPLVNHPRVISDPWKRNALDPIQSTDRVLFLGSSLTMVDGCLSLAARGHQGPLYSRSRHGLLPQPHAKATPVQLEVSPSTDLISTLTRLIREGGENWRGVVDALRPRTVEMWQSLSWKERERFRNRLQVFWDVHRHRIPEAASRQIDSLRSGGQLQIEKGRLQEVVVADGALAATFSASRLTELEVDWIVNCTGPNPNLKAAKIPLIESAVATGLAEYDPLGLGLMVDNDGRTNDAGDVWTLGPMCRGCRLETTAIPEIRNQALKLAGLISHVS